MPLRFESGRVDSMPWKINPPIAREGGGDPGDRPSRARGPKRFRKTTVNSTITPIRRGYRGGVAVGVPDEPGHELDTSAEPERTGQRDADRSDAHVEPSAG